MATTGGGWISLGTSVMHHWVRRSFPVLALTGLLSAMAWAVSLGTLPRADFVFNNEDDVKTVDPAKAAGHPEHRIANCLFEGLLRMMPAHRPPDELGLVPLEIVPGVADLPDISADGKTYTFRLRREAIWSNGDPLTTADFVWSWRRTLHPDTASEYAFQLHYLRGAKAYQEGTVVPGDRVEVELTDRRDPIQPFPRGTLVRGILREIVRPEPIAELPGETGESRQRREADWKRRWIYLVDELGRGRDGEVIVDWDQAATRRAFAVEHPSDKLPAPYRSVPIERVHHVLPDFDSTVGVRAIDPYTLEVNLHGPTPFFSELTAFYPLFPTHRGCIEQYGSPGWTKPERMVTNGPFLLHSRRIRDRIRLVKNPRYWDRDHIRLNVVDALALKSRLTAMNMFLNGELDWNHAPPSNMIPDLRQRSDYVTGPALQVYFYRLNTERKPLDDKRVRQAFNMAIDKQAICSHVTLAGERPARSLVPLGMPGYEPSLCADYNPALAQQRLREAGYPDGIGFPRLEILYNSDELHKSIAEVIQQQWKRNLGINVQLRGIAWPAYLEQMHKSDFDICRAGWVPDYTDPNTFLDLFVTNGLQNATRWGHSEYDALIAAAGQEPNGQRRASLLKQAETILMDELPILPIFYYVTKNQVHPRVRGFYSNVHDNNPIYALRVDDTPSQPNR